MISDYSTRFKLTAIADWAHKKREVWITNYLESSLSNVIDKYKKIDNVGEYVDNAPIWVCWWTGMETAPKLVKQCIKSIYKNANGHPVNLITKDNYQDYLDIPEYMLSKAESGKMKIAHLCDYIRVNLLYQYGGLWLDSTIFCSNKIDEFYYNIPFYTAKSETDNNCKYLSKMRWVTFILGSYKNNVVMSFLKDCFERYWTENDNAIDYLFFDSLIDIGYRNVSVIKNAIDNIPINNIHRDDLQAAMNAELPATEFNTIIKNDTVLYKLSWRETYKEVNSEGKDTVFKYFLSINNEV